MKPRTIVLFLIVILLLGAAYYWQFYDRDGEMGREIAQSSTAPAVQLAETTPEAAAPPAQDAPAQATPRVTATGTAASSDAPTTTTTSDSATSAPPAGAATEAAAAPAAVSQPAEAGGTSATIAQPAGVTETQLAALPPTGDGSERQAAGAGAAKPGPEVAPAFDIVRVEPDGSTVIAGQGPPGGEVTILDGTRVLGSVSIDARGQWVFMPEGPLAPGNHELGLRTTRASGQPLLSQEVVVVVVPEAVEVAEAKEESGAELVLQVVPGPASTAEGGAGDDPGRRLVTEREQALAGTPERPLVVLASRGAEQPSRILQQPIAVEGGLGEGTLLLESVDYDEAGQAIVGGRAEPGSRLVIYLDNQPAGSTTAAADGRWHVILGRLIAFGLHHLRVDQLDGAGKVLARVETPFSRAELAPEPSQETMVVVQPGNSLWRIARRIYGQGVRYSVIYEANNDQIGDPDLIYPGQIFVVPQVN